MSQEFRQGTVGSVSILEIPRPSAGRFESWELESFKVRLANYGLEPNTAHLSAFINKICPAHHYTHSFLGTFVLQRSVDK